MILEDSASSLPRARGTEGATDTHFGQHSSPYGEVTSLVELMVIPSALLRNIMARFLGAQTHSIDAFIGLAHTLGLES